MRQNFYNNFIKIHVSSQLSATSPDILSLEPMLETAKALGDAQYRGLIMIAPPSPNKDGETMRQDLKTGGIPVFKTIIRRTVGYQKAALDGKIRRW